MLSNARYMMKDLQTQQRFSVAGLPQVTDPEQTYADITRSDYENYVRDYRDF